MNKNTLINTTNYSYLYSNSKKVIILLQPELKNICEAHIAKRKGDYRINSDTYSNNKFSFLLNNGFFKNGDDFIELSEEQAQLKMPKAIAFEVTEKCNLSCTYCTFGKFYHKTDYKRSDKKIEIDTAIAYIDYIYKKFGKISSNFGFYGGEPLLNFKLIFKVVEYLKEKDPEQDFRFDMTTNGLLLDKHADFLASNNFFISISLDGNEYQNRFRVFPDGSNSTETVIKNILFFKENYPDFFKNRISFAVTLPANGSVNEINNFFLKTFQQLPEYNRLRENEMNHKNIEEFNFTFGKQKKSKKKIDYFLNQNYRDYFKLLEIEKQEQKYVFPNGTCLPFEIRHLITAQGSILPCEKIDYKYKLGTIKNGKIDINPEEIAKSYNNYIQKTMQLCRTCYTLNCSLCMFLIEWENDTPVCPNYFNKNDIKKAISEIEDEYDDNKLLIDKLWFYIESYVFVFHGNDVSMLYNSVNGKSIITLNSGIIILLKKLDNNLNSNVIKITKEFYHSQENFDFFKNLRNEFMGDIIDSGKSSCMPFISKNIIKISDPIIQELQFTNIRESEKGHILQHVTQVDLYLDTNFNHLSNYEKKQILITGDNIELNTTKIFDTLEKLLKVDEVFLYSNDLFLYPKIVNKIKSTNTELEINKECVFLINLNYLQIFKNNVLNELKCESIKAIDPENCIFKITINVPILKEQLETAFNFFKQLSIPVIYTFFIEQDADIQVFDELISEYNIENYEIKPVFTGTNLTLFEQNVFVNEEDIMSSLVTAKEINIRKEINSNFFGKIAILPDGKVSCDIQKPIYTEISDHSLYKQVYSEITKGEGLWKLTRDKVEPCRTCIYKFLCPPISEYELKLKRYNLCTYN